MPLETMPLGVPVDLGREAARQAAREELSKQVYQQAEPSLSARVVRWLYEKLSGLLDQVAGVSPGGYVGLLVVVLLVVAAVVAIRLKVGPLGRAARGEDALFLGRPRSAAEHRSAADRHAAAGEWAEAVRERLRAVIRSLEERSLLDPRPGRTADEAAAEAGRALPGCAAGLRDAARLFDDVWYGGRPAGAAGDQQLRDLDARVQASRPVLAGGPR
jgi:uncharacterized protein DUF4129